MHEIIGFLCRKEKPIDAALLGSIYPCVLSFRWSFLCGTHLNVGDHVKRWGIKGTDKFSGDLS